VPPPPLPPHTHNHFTALWTLSGTNQVSWYQKVHFTIFWIFWCKMKITQSDTPTIWMDCHPLQTNWCPYLCHPHHFYARCPSWHNPPNLSWLGTGTKYAGLHTRWLLLLPLTVLTTVFAPVYIDMTANANHSSNPKLHIAHLITSLGTYQKLFQNPQNQNRASFL